MRYMDAFTVWFRRKDWFVNLLLLSVANLIPVAGMMVVLGYEGDVYLALRERPADDPPKFEFARFAAYLQRGAWPILLLLIWSFALGIITAIGYLFGVLVISAADPPDWLLVILIALWIAAVLLVAVTFAVLTTPMMLRAALTQSFQGGLNLAFYREFLRRMVGPLLIAMVLVWLANLALTLGGLLICCVGVYITSTLGGLAWWRMMFMLYEEYLARGGTPVTMALTPTPAPAFPVSPAPPPAA